MYRKIICLFVLSLLVACGQQPKTQTQELTEGAVQEIPVTEIVLTGPLTDRDAEISGMAWYGNILILLPQYPDFDGGDHFYALPNSATITSS